MIRTLDAGASMDDGRESSRLFLLSTAVLVPLACGPWLHDLWVLPKLLAAAAGLFFTGGALVLHAPREGGGSVGSGLDAPLGALLAVALASALLSGDPWSNLAGQYMHYVCGAWGLLLLALGYLLSGSLMEKGWPERLGHWISAGSVPIACLALLEWALFEQRILTRSTMGSPVLLGLYLAAVLPLALHAAMERPRSPLRWAILALVAAAMLASRTRSAWLGSLAGCAVYLHLRGASYRKAAFLALASGLLAAAFLSLRADNDKNDNQRLELLRASASMAWERPLFGVGPAAFTRAFRLHRSAEYGALTRGAELEADAHNDWFQVLATTGVLGLAAYAWLHLRAFRFLANEHAGILRERAAALGSLSTIFLTAKINVLVWPVLFLGALLAGAVFSRRGGRRHGAAAATVLAAGLVLAGVRLAAADRDLRVGLEAWRAGRVREAAARLERAVALNPLETLYRRTLADLIWETAADEPEGASRSLMLARPAELALGAVRWHPEDPVGYQILGRAELRRFEWGAEPRLAQARAALEAALRLDPWDSRIREDWERLARLLQERARERKIRRNRRS